MFARGEACRGMGKMSEGELQVQASNYGTSKPQGLKVEHRK